MSPPSPPDSRRQRELRQELKRLKQQRRADAAPDEEDEDDDVEVERVPLRPPTKGDLLAAAAMTLIAASVGAAYWIYNGSPSPW